MTKPHIRLRGPLWCVYRTPASPRPVIIGSDFERVCAAARRKFRPPTPVRVRGLRR